MILVAGLGNPGAKYAATRHNIGWMLVDLAISNYKAQPLSTKAKAELYKAGDVLFLKPLTYMNASGEAIAAIAQFYKPSRIIIAHDEMELSFARLKLQRAGSHGGHNGLKSVQSHCGDEYERIRLGIGRPSAQAPAIFDMSAAARECISPLDNERARCVLAWVLGEFSAQERKILDEEFLPRALKALKQLISSDLSTAQNLYNR